MLRLLFHATVRIDRLLASKGQRGDAEWHAIYAHAHHGLGAIDHLHGLLADPRRRRSRRTLRLAIADLIRNERLRR